MSEGKAQPVSFGVLGGGSWGSALAILLAKNGYEVNLWVRDEQHSSAMQQDRTNNRYLPGILFPESMNVTSNLELAIRNVQDIVIVVPSRAYRSVCRQIAATLKHDAGVVIASKGLEHNTLKLLHTVVTEELSIARKSAVISGPTFAKEVAAGLPTAVTVASHDIQYANHLAQAFHNDAFRAYTTDDVVGVEIGGAVKNVMAIAAGIADGLGLGANTRAALITRGLVEIKRLGVALGGHKETFMGLAGLGDLVLTCTDNQSRNRRVGLALAKGKSIDDILADLGQVAEGIYAAEEVHLLAEHLKIDMPISEQVFSVLYRKLEPRRAVHDLFSRDMRPENDEP